MTSAENELDIQPTHKFHRGHFFSPNGGEKIYYKNLIPESLSSISSKELFQIVILHDLGTYHELYTPLGEYLFNQFGQKVIVTWMDFKGHGMSKGVRGQISNFEHLANDVNFLMKQDVGNVSLKCPVYLIGEGLGAQVFK